MRFDSVRLGLPIALVLSLPTGVRAAAGAGHRSLSGRIVKSEMEAKSGKHGPVTTRGHVKIIDEKGKVREFEVTRRTRVTCDHKTAEFDRVGMPGVCDRVIKAVYETKTERLLSLVLAAAPKT